ncbi:MAG: MmgE/PrpD family protein [Candidatus Entotheonellia bacterium]
MIPAEVIARHIVGRGYEALPAAVVEMTKRLILDAFATTIGGSPCGWCRMLVEQTLEWGGRAESTILPHGHRVPAPYAAWIHSTMMHSLEYDAIHEGATVHALTAPFPAALAAAEARGQVTVAASPFVQRLVGRPYDPHHQNPLDARLSLPFTVANTLLRGRLEIGDAEGAALRDPALHQLAQKVTVVVDSDLAPPNAPAPQRLEITRRSGDRIVRRIDVLKGAPGRALSWDDTVDKFWTCWRYANTAIPESHGWQAIERVASLEQEEDIGAIVRLLRAS